MIHDSCRLTLFDCDCGPVHLIKDKTPISCLRHENESAISPEPPSFALKRPLPFSADFRHLSTFLVSIPRLFACVNGTPRFNTVGEFFSLYTDGPGVPGCHSTKWAAYTGKFDNAPGHHQRLSEHAEAYPAGGRLQFPK